MATFNVLVHRISAPAEHHPNADRLSIIRIGGFMCISGKLSDGSHRYKEGDYVAYIPEASVLPEGILRSLDFWRDDKGTLAGPEGNRVKAIALRGIVSQGVLFPIDQEDDGLVLAVPIWIGDECVGHSRYTVTEGQDVADKLGIVKYVPPIPQELAGDAISLFDYTAKFDVENIQNITDMFEDGEPVHVTEKLHGTCMQIGYVPHMQHPECFFDGNIYVTQKGLGNSGLALANTKEVDGVRVSANERNRYVTTLRAMLAEGFGDRIKALAHEQMASVQVFGELFGRGIQDLHYGTKAPEFRVFDIRIDNEFLPHKAVAAVAERLGLQTVPELYVGPFDRAAIEAVRDGKDAISGTNVREGVVIRSATEARHPYHGRKMAKWVSPEYLVRKGAGDEFQ